MPRSARIKFESGVYHIMIRSLSEIMLFSSAEDKNKYLEIMKKYKKLYQFKIYAYCMMSNHGHFIIDCCGADISKIMHSINQSYAFYFNKKYERHGHVFADRFKSIPIKSNRQLANTSAYIHNNPKDISEYKTSIEKYPFSSLPIYLGKVKDNFYLIDTFALLDMFKLKNKNPEMSYLKYVKKHINYDKDKINAKEDNSKKITTRILLIRNIPPKTVVEFIKEYISPNFSIHIKYNHSNNHYKSICVLLMRSVCNMNYKDIQMTVGNISISSIWRLCNNGLKLIYEMYNNLIEDFIEKYKLA